MFEPRHDLCVRIDSKLTPADTADAIPTLTQHRLDVLNGLDASSEQNIVDQDEIIPLLLRLAILNREKTDLSFSPPAAHCEIIPLLSDRLVSLSHSNIIHTHMLGLRA